MRAKKATLASGSSWCEADNHTERRSVISLPHPQIDAALYQFAVELQIGIDISLMRDVMGQAFVPHHVAVTYRSCESRLPP
jgi:hypothetical protein